MNHSSQTKAHEQAIKHLLTSLAKMKYVSLALTWNSIGKQLNTYTQLQNLLVITKVSAKKQTDVETQYIM